MKDEKPLCLYIYSYNKQKELFDKLKGEFNVLIDKINDKKEKLKFYKKQYDQMKERYLSWKKENGKLEMENHLLKFKVQEEIKINKDNNEKQS